MRQTARALGIVAISTLLTHAATASADPPAFDGYVESSTYPIRVHYPQSVGESVAEQALGYAENAWKVQIEQMGFPVPNTVDDKDQIIPGMWIYLDPNAAYNHAEPIGDNPDTPWTDCTVRTIVGSVAPAELLEMVVGHELNHALEMTADCGESPFAYENTTMAVGVLTNPDNELFKEWLPSYQGYPHHGVDCAFGDDKRRFYHYGASLFQVFLEDAYGNADGKLLSSLWEAAKQDGSVVGIQSVGLLDVPNDPNFMDAVDAVLPDVGFDGAFAEFARWRYFVGARDDGHHFTHGASWVDSEVKIDTTHTLAQLPIAEAVPQHVPNDYGSVYLQLSLLDLEPDTGVTVSFEGDPSVSWNVDVLLVRPDRSAEVRHLDTSSGDQHLLLDDLDGYGSAVLVVTNLSDGNHDPDDFTCVNTAAFSYGLELTDLSTPPSVTPEDPAEPAPVTDEGGVQTITGCGCTLPGTHDTRSLDGWPALLMLALMAYRRRNLATVNLATTQRAGKT